MTRLALQMLISTLLLAVACSRPEVEVPREEGKAGMFCVTRADCGAALTCTEGRCCGRESCPGTCEAVVKAGTTAAFGETHGAAASQQLRRRCMTLCCAGKTEAEIQDILGNGLHGGVDTTP